MSVNQQPDQDRGAQVPEKSEVLLLDKDERVREALGKILTTEGFILTATDNHERALSLIREKYYAVALLDLDTPEPEEGFDLLGRVRLSSPATEVVLLSNRQTFEIATRGFRNGAADVVAKSPESVKYLTGRVAALCLEARRADERDQLLKDVLELHDDFLKLLMESFRKAKEAEAAATGQSGVRLAECVVLVVDDNPRTAPGLAEALGKDGHYKCVSATNGGEALDYATSSGFHIALVKEHLPDLSGTTVSKSLQANSPDGIVLIFNHPGQEPGYVALVEQKQTIDLIPELRRPDQLVGVINELRSAYMAKSTEKRYLQAFRQENLNFLKRYVEFRKKAVKTLPDAR